MRFAYSPLSIAILTALASQTYANESQISEEIKTNTVSMTPIEVEVKAKQEVGKIVYSKEDLEKTPNSSKNITDFLKVNPNVQFSQSQNASEIKPKFTWDMRTTYDINLGKDLKAIFGLTINNVTNRINTYVTGATSTSSTPRVMTEIGRQFIADVTFKF